MSISEFDIPRRRLSFFTLLPYDIREIIYSFTIPDDLPPFSPRLPEYISGYVCSCRHAHQEILELASQQQKQFVKQFQTSFEDSIGLPISIEDDIKDVTVILPYAALGFITQRTQSMHWKRDVFNGLHLLFAKYFKVVRIHFEAKEGDPQPDSSTLLERGRVEVYMHRLLRDMSYVISHINRTRASTTINSLDAIFGYDRTQTTHCPREFFHAERICLSWDLRTAPDDEPLILNGKVHHAPIVPMTESIKLSDRKLPYLVSQKVAKYMSSSANDPADLAYRNAVYYHLRDTQRLAGEMGLMSLTRWEVKAEELYFNGLVNGVETEAGYFSSAGFGQEIDTGLRGVSESMFEEEERQVSDLLYDT